MLSQHHSWLLSNDWPPAEEIVELDLSRSPLILDNPGFPRLCALPRLQSLVLSRCEISDMRPLLGCMHLEFLGVAGNKIKRIPEQVSLIWKGLVAIDLADNRLSRVEDLGHFRGGSLKAIQVSGNLFASGWWREARDILPQVLDWGEIGEDEEVSQAVAEREEEICEKFLELHSDEAVSDEDDSPTIEQPNFTPQTSTQTHLVPTPSQEPAALIRYPGELSIPASPPPGFVSPPTAASSRFDTVVRNMEISSAAIDLALRPSSVPVPSGPPPRPPSRPGSREKTRPAPVPFADNSDLESTIQKNQQISDSARERLSSARASYLEFLTDLLPDTSAAGLLSRLAQLLLQRERCWENGERPGPCMKCRGSECCPGACESEISEIENALSSQKSEALAELRRFTDTCDAFASKIELHSKFLSELDSERKEAHDVLESYLESFSSASHSPPVESLCDRLRLQHASITRLARSRGGGPVLDELLRDRQELIDQIISMSGARTRDLKVGSNLIKTPSLDSVPRPIPLLSSQGNRPKTGPVSRPIQTPSAAAPQPATPTRPFAPQTPLRQTPNTATVPTPRRSLPPSASRQSARKQEIKSPRFDDFFSIPRLRTPVKLNTNSAKQSVVSEGSRVSTAENHVTAGIKAQDAASPEKSIFRFTGMNIPRRNSAGALSARGLRDIIN